MNNAFPYLFVVLTLVTPLSGCSKSGVSREITFGRVTFDGKPIHGQIRFLMENRPTAQGAITDGEYRIDFRGGVPVGKGKVKIEAASKSEGVIYVGVDKPPVPRYRELIPAKYNKETELTVEIVEGKENEIHFDLEP